MPKGKEEQYYDWPTNDARGRYEDGGEVKEYKKGGFFSKEKRQERQDVRAERKDKRKRLKNVRKTKRRILKNIRKSKDSYATKDMYKNVKKKIKSKAKERKKDIKAGKRIDLDLPEPTYYAYDPTSSGQTTTTDPNKSMIEVAEGIKEAYNRKQKAKAKVYKKKG